MKLLRLFALTCVVLAAGCRSGPVLDSDRPQLTPDVHLIDAMVRSRALDRDVPVRLVLPTSVSADISLSVVYLLHGSGVTYHDWTNHSAVASFAAHGWVLVFPDLPGAYYINQQNGSHQRYEDFLIDELPGEVNRLVPNAAADRQHTAIVGISRGGFGAAVLGMKHPQTFGFVGLLSPALDYPELTFRLLSPLQSLQLRRIFGPGRSDTRLMDDPFLLVRKLQRQDSPYFFVACGGHDVLFASAGRFVRDLSEAKLPAEFHPLQGGHDWGTWNQALPLLETSLLKSLSTREGAVVSRSAAR